MRQPCVSKQETRLGIAYRPRIECNRYYRIKDKRQNWAPLIKCFNRKPQAKRNRTLMHTRHSSAKMLILFTKNTLSPITIKFILRWTSHPQKNLRTILILIASTISVVLILSYKVRSHDELFCESANDHGWFIDQSFACECRLTRARIAVAMNEIARGTILRWWEPTSVRCVTCTCGW